MDLIKNKNYSRQNNIKINGNTKFFECNFSQYNINTLINFISNTIFNKLIFKNCNLSNCIIPDFSEIIKCNTIQQTILITPLFEDIDLYDEDGVLLYSEHITIGEEIIITPVV